MARPSPPPGPPGGAERKLVTVLLIDVDEAREGFADMDPEDTGRVLSGPLARVRAEVEAHGGVVEETLGGRTVALFGIPRTRDDDPERAVRAALAVRDVLSGGALRVQAAVATGEALVRPAGSRGERRRVAGDPMGAAARLQELTPAGTVLVSEATRRATERAVAYGPVRQAPPGAREPLPAWPALAPRAGPASPSRRFPPLVARDGELEALRAAAGRACDGAGPELVTVVGAAGIGKSRLLAELADRLASWLAPSTPPPAWRQGRALPYGDGPTFGALAEAVKAEAGILESDGAELATERLVAAAGAVADPVTAAWVAGHLRRLVGVGAGRPGSAGPTTAADREEEFAAWRRFLHGLAANRPLVLALEDLHRADDALLDFVEGLVDPDAGPAAVLVLATARPELLERRPGWGAGGTTIQLEPLDDPDTTGLLATLLAHHGLPAEVDPALLGRVGGNPLFAEEYVRMLRDRGDRQANRDTPAPPSTEGLRLSPPVPLPTGVHAIVAARLDALGAADKAVLHDAAVLGQVGWLGALAEITGLDLPDLEAAWTAWRRASSSSAPPPRGWPGRSSTPSATPWSATSPTARCCGRPGPTSTGGPPPGSRGWPPTGPRAGPSCSPTTTGPPCRSPGPPAPSRPGWPAAPWPPCATPATGPPPSAAGRPRPGSTPRPWS